MNVDIGVDTLGNNVSCLYVAHKGSYVWNMTSDVPMVKLVYIGLKSKDTLHEDRSTS